MKCTNALSLNLFLSQYLQRKLYLRFIICFTSICEYLYVFYCLLNTTLLTIVRKIWTSTCKIYIYICGILAVPYKFVLKVIIYNAKYIYDLKIYILCIYCNNVYAFRTLLYLTLFSAVENTSALSFFFTKNILKYTCAFPLKQFFSKVISYS